MSEQEAFKTWLKDNNIFQYEEGEYHDPVDVEVLEFSGMVWQACADRKDKIIEQQAAELAALRGFAIQMYEYGYDVYKEDITRHLNEYGLIDKTGQPTALLTGERE